MTARPEPEERGEFGHEWRNGGGLFIDTWGAGPFRIVMGAREAHFEDSDRFGPLLVSKRGVVLERQPGERSWFWDPYHMWLKGGRRLNGDLCVWDEPRKGTYYRLGGLTFGLTEPDLPGGRYVEVPAPTDEAPE